jgi:hypothetical protein
MLRAELVASLNNVKAAIVKANLYAKLEAILTQPRGKAEALAAFLLPSMTDYLYLSRNYSPSEQKITQILQISDLEDIDWWVRIFSPADDKFEMVNGQLHRVYFNINSANGMISQIVNLLARDTDPPGDGIIKNIIHGTDLPGRLILTLPETEGKHSSPSRVTRAIDAITTMYEAIASLLGRSESDLIIASCDSGSDKLFDFAGLSDVIEKVKEIIESVWDRAIFHREKKISESLDLITKSLPLFSQIAELENDQKLAPEHAEMIRRKITSGVAGFLETGSLIPEIKTRTFFDPNKILAPQATLLLPAPTADNTKDVNKEEPNGTTQNTDDELRDASPKERAQLEVMLRKMREELE